MFDANRDILRFTTAGSVDDGKSTLIGRLLYDSQVIMDDQYQAIVQSSLQKGEEQVNLAWLTDGLKAEREQGITIDVAFRYFSRPGRKFILADNPGHTQYTRNMVTGASTSNLAVILLDARKGLTPQTHRHVYIASLLGIRHMVVCINKMDLVNFSREQFELQKKSFLSFIENLKFSEIHFIPVSALLGDNVVLPSSNMDWYKGPCLLELLETIEINQTDSQLALRFPVQYVIKPLSSQHPDYRGYAGSIAEGKMHVGDKVKVLPSGFETEIVEIRDMKGLTNCAAAPMAVTIRLKDELDISRGDMLVGIDTQAPVLKKAEAVLCWMSNEKLIEGSRFIVRHTTNETRCIVEEVRGKIDVGSPGHYTIDKNIVINDLCVVKLKFAHALYAEPYELSKRCGSFILINEFTNETVAAGMIL